MHADKKFHLYWLWLKRQGFSPDRSIWRLFLWMKQFPGQRFICRTASASLEAERSWCSLATKGILKQLFEPACAYAAGYHCSFYHHFLLSNFVMQYRQLWPEDGTIYTANIIVSYKLDGPCLYSNRPRRIAAILTINNSRRLSWNQ